MTQRIFVASLDDSPGVLNRVASLFRRRQYNIVSLSVGRTHKPGISRMTVVVEGDDHTARQLVANLQKLVCVLDVQDVTEQPTVLRDLALIKLHVEDQRRMEVFQICDVFSARVVDVTPETMILEMTDTPEKIRRLVAVLQPLGLTEMVQCGAVAITYDSPVREAVKAA